MAVKKKAVKRSCTRWTKAELSTLKKMYKSTSNVEIAKVLKCSISRVMFKAHRLGLKKSKTRLMEMGRNNIAKRWDNVRRGRRRAAR